MLTLKSTNTELFENINWENYQRVDGLLSIPVVSNDIVTARVMVSRKTSFIVDLTNWKSDLIFYEFNDTEPIGKLDMALNIITNNYEAQGVIETRKEKLEGGDKSALHKCIIMCSISAFFMGAADGPLPLADIAALTYLALCIDNCHGSHA